MIEKIQDMVLKALDSACDKADCLLVTHAIGQTTLAVYCPFRNGSDMRGTMLVDFSVPDGKLMIKAYEGKVDPISGKRDPLVAAKPEKPKVVSLYFHQLCDKGFVAFTDWMVETFKKPVEKAERQAVEIPADLVEQLVSSDGTVLAEKDSAGKWQDV